MAILIVEDDLIVAEDLSYLLKDAGFNNLFVVNNVADAIEVLQKNSINFALLDVKLNEKETGVEIAQFINRNIHIPHLYITSYTDQATIDQLKRTHPAGYITKPFLKDALLANINIALYNYPIFKSNHSIAQTNSSSINYPEKNKDLFNCVVDNHLLIKDNYDFIRIPLMEILWIESARNYLVVKTVDNKHTIRYSLKRLHQQLPADKFIKCFKKYIININYIKKYSEGYIDIENFQIPVSRQAKNSVLKALHQHI